MASSNSSPSPPSLHIALPADILELIVRECHLMDQPLKHAMSDPAELRLQREENGGQTRLLSKLRLTNKSLMRMASKYLFKVVKASRCRDPIFRFSIATSYSTLVQEIVFDDSGRKQGVESVEILLSFLPFFVNLRSAVLTRNGFGMFAPPPVENSSSSSHDRKIESSTDANYSLRRQLLNNYTSHLTSLHLQETYSIGSIIYWLYLCCGNVERLRLEGNLFLRPRDEAAIENFQKSWPGLTKKMVELDLDRQVGESELKRKRLAKTQETFPEWFLGTAFPPLVHLTLRCLNLDQNDRRFLVLFQPTLKHLVIEQNLKSRSGSSVPLPHLPHLVTLRLVGGSHEIDATLKTTLDEAGRDSPLPFPSLRSLSFDFINIPTVESFSTIEAFASLHIKTLAFLEWIRKDAWSQHDLNKVKTWSFGNVQISLSSSLSRSSHSSDSSYSSNSTRFSHSYFSREPISIESQIRQPITGTREEEKTAQRQKFVEELRNTAAYGRRALEVAAGRKDVNELKNLARKLGSLEAERNVDFV